MGALTRACNVLFYTQTNAKNSHLGKSCWREREVSVTFSLMTDGLGMLELVGRPAGSSRQTGLSNLLKLGSLINISTACLLLTCRSRFGVQIPRGQSIGFQLFRQKCIEFHCCEVIVVGWSSLAFKKIISDITTLQQAVFKSKL